MKHIVRIPIAVACVVIATACGGGGDGGGALTQADEGIWSNLNGGTGPGMQAIILSDGSYWGLYGGTQSAQFAFDDASGVGVLHGTASASGGSVSGAYTGFFPFISDGLFNGTYSGTASARSNINLTFNSPLDVNSPVSLSPASPPVSTVTMRYDAIYNQPASIATIVNNYPGNECFITPGAASEEHCGVYVTPFDPSGIDYTYTRRLVIDLTQGLIEVTGTDGQTASMSGTIAPHGTTGNVFDVSLTTTANEIDMPVGTTVKGILFQTSGSQGHTEIIAAGENLAYYYTGQK